MQTTYTQDPALSYPGTPADTGFKDDVSTVVEELLGIEPGLVVVRGTGGDITARKIPDASADLDAIKTNGVTAASQQVINPGDCDGVDGAGPYVLPARLAMVLDSDADWNATSASLVYEDENGVQQTEALAIPDGGNATLTSVGYARRFVSLTIPAQAGAGGSYTLGRAAEVTLDGGDVLGVSIRTHKARQDGAIENAENYEDEDQMPVRRKGRIFVTVENAFEAGDRPLVRCIASGAEQLGAIRVGDNDSGDCFPWSGARLLTSGSAGAIGVLEVNAK